MGRFLKVLKSGRVILLIVFLLLALLAISPRISGKGVAITYVDDNSAASKAGIAKPGSNLMPTQFEIVQKIETYNINNESDYYLALERAEKSMIDNNLKEKVIMIKTDIKTYSVLLEPETESALINEYDTINVTVERPVEIKVNGKIITRIQNVTEERKVQKTGDKVVGVKDIGLKIVNKPRTNLRKGIDLEGGVRVLLKPEGTIDAENFTLVMKIMENRLNHLGLSNIQIKRTSNVLGDQFISVEATGYNEKQVINLLSQQGNFEARIANQTVFIGGKDIKNVCTSAECSRIESCTTSSNLVYCSYFFQVTIDEEGAKRFADYTRNLQTLPSNDPKNPKLNQSIDFYLDGDLKQSLDISANLKGRVETKISITGTASGRTEAEARTNSKEEIKNLQAVLLTGSLPVKMKIVQSDSFSPELGEEKFQNTMLVGLLAIIAVGVVILVRFRKITISLPIMMTMLFEVFLVLGFAAFFKWELDLVAMAGIIIAIGSGVDDQIVIVDEAMNRKDLSENWKQRLKKAFFIIFGSYLATVAGVIPLFAAGAGMLKGFAFTTVVGISMGVFITRPAFAVFVKEILKE